MQLCISTSSASGRAYRDVSFTASEGTWMSLDVSRDGKTLAFDLLNDIYVMPAEGGVATVIHSGPAIQRSPQFSPDGKTLLYLSDETGADNIWISALDGSQPRQLSQETLAMISGTLRGAPASISARRRHALTPVICEQRPSRRWWRTRRML